MHFLFCLRHTQLNFSYSNQNLGTFIQLSSHSNENIFRNKERNLNLNIWYVSWWVQLMWQTTIVKKSFTYAIDRRCKADIFNGSLLCITTEYTWSEMVIDIKMNFWFICSTIFCLKYDARKKFINIMDEKYCEFESLTLTSFEFNSD